MLGAEIAEAPRLVGEDAEILPLCEGRAVPRRRKAVAGSASAFPNLADRLLDIVHRPQPSPDCVPRISDEKGATVILPTPKPTAPLNPGEINPGLAPGMNTPPRNQRAKTADGAER